MKRLLPSLLALFAPALAGAAEGKVDFNYDIRPIISSKCYHCHGPDEKSRKAKLRLDLREDALKERDGVCAIVPGNARDSELLARIVSTDPDEVMPPPKEGHAVDEKEAKLLQRWIEEGAEYKEHWAWIKPVRATVPESAEFHGWVKNPIDAFVVQRQVAAGLRPSAEADAYTLIRRLSLDLTGLPPTPVEVEAFVADSTRDVQAAYPVAVDRLLASPAFGERWARLWLDLARYADSTGYGSDKFRLNIWPYRDWVIGAFNRDLPYDEFTIEQLAGDLLPNATPDQIAATAFHRNTMTNVEGGTIDEEYRVAAVKDRIATTGQVWMGLTVGCAQCHSHKFDPIPQTDYYRFFGVFNQTEDSDREDEAPTMPLPSAAETEKMDGLKKEIAALEAQMKTRSPEFDAEQAAWEKEVSRKALWTTLVPTEAKTASGITLATQPDGSLLAIGNERPATDTYTLKLTSDLRGITAFRIQVLADDSLPSHGPGRADNGNAVLSELRIQRGPSGTPPTRGRFVRVTQPDAPTGLALAEVEVFSEGKNLALKGTATQSGTGFGGDAKRAIDGNTSGDFARKSVAHTETGGERWWEVDLGVEAEIDFVKIWNRTDGGLQTRLHHFQVSVLDAEHKPLWEDQVVEPPQPSVALLPGPTRTLALTNPSADFAQAGFTPVQALDGDPKTGWAWAGGAGQAHAAVFEVAAPFDGAGDEFTLTLRQDYGTRHTLGRFGIAATTEKPAPRELPEALRAILAIDAAQRTPAQLEQVSAYFRPLSKRFAELGKQAEAKRTALAAIKPVAVPVLRELAPAKQRETHLLTKGNYLTPTPDKLEPGLLSAFASYVPPETKIDRLAAARWLVDRQNPLTARVTVNRFWAQFFGTGLVETEEDFGTQGTLPSHPELLDWLAVTFETPKAEGGLGWDMKELIKLIVTSATYRQASKVTPDIVEKDARNRLLTHFPRRRLDAETVRDQALALSGLLSPKQGGPSVYPPQPDGLWKVAFNGGQNAYPTSKGEDRYRRGLYTFWRRTMPPPSMATFDAPSRESCTVRRIATNTPLQAFVTLNDPVFVECSQALARRILREGGADTAARLRFALRLCLGRPATDAQVAALTELYDAELATYRADEPGALKLATEPAGPLPADTPAAELAAWTVVANVLLNLDGVLTRN